MMKPATLGPALAALLVGMPAAAQTGGNGVIYMGAYDRAIHVVDEATLEVVDRIDTRTGIPVDFVLTEDHDRMYVLNSEFEEIEVLDLVERTSIDRFTLSSPRDKVRIWGFQIDPSEEYAVLITMRYTKLDDRFRVGPPKLLKYDLDDRQVTDTIPWPEGEERERARVMFSPDGEYLYFFGRDILVLETENFTEVDRWALSQPIEDGLGPFSFGFPVSENDQPGFHTGLFRFTDPVQNRRMMGIARVNLTEKDFDFYTLGPSERVSFSLAPGGRRAYGLVQEIGNYELWTFDLEAQAIESRRRFEGRPRMAVTASSNGELLYIYQAGATIDVYEADTFEFIRTVTYDFDMIDFALVPEGARATGG